MTDKWERKLTNRRLYVGLNLFVNSTLTKEGIKDLWGNFGTDFSFSSLKWDIARGVQLFSANLEFFSQLLSLLFHLLVSFQFFLSIKNQKTSNNPLKNQILHLCAFFIN